MSTPPATHSVPRTHGVREFTELADRSSLHAEEILLLGHSVVPAVLDRGQLAEARERIDAVYAQQVEEIGGREHLERIDDADIARCLLSYDDFFLDFATNPQVYEIVEHLLGEFFTLMSQNAIINQPTDDHYQNTWHRDLNYQHFVSSRPLAISALYCIDDFTADSGGTRVLPGTHRAEKFPSPEFVERRDVGVEAAAGSVLLFDAMLFHRAGTNSSGRTRRAVNHIFTLPLIQQQISLPSALQGRFADDPRLRRLLGYESAPGESTQEWRQRRLPPADAR